jgi:hypothetical protein
MKIAINVAMQAWTSHPRYLRSLIVGGERFDLVGQASRARAPRTEKKGV